MPETNNSEQQRSWTGQFQAAGENLVNRADDLIQEGNARRVIVRNRDGDVLMRVPLNPALIVGALVTIVNPVLTVVLVIVSLLAHLKLEIVRERDDEIV